MNKMIVKEYETYSNNFGNSSYLLLSQTMRDILSKPLKEEFDNKKHKIKVQISLNKRGEPFVAFWFVKKIKRKGEL